MKNLLLLSLILYSTTATASDSICYGSASNGRLEGGVQLPYDGNNFTSYSITAELLGRTYVHSNVRDILLSTYKALEKEMPDKVYKYAETGFRQGGRFKPHRTHRNGSSVDFMVPVVNEAGKSVHLPTHYFNKLGYAIEFDNTGSYDGYQIDYEAMAAHIVHLHQTALQNGADIKRVIFDNVLQPLLFKTSYGTYLKKHIRFLKKRVWVRHDEHYHVDFSIACKSL